jgi:ABC-2 type transport system ATP-binding protein
MSPVVSLENVCKLFGSQIALRKVSFDVPQGSVFALLGENGAGKSTCIRIMLGLLEADAGTCHVFGRDSLRESLKIRQRIGYVAERPSLYEWMTVKEIGWFASGFYGDNYLARFRQRTDQFRLPPRQRLKTLSKGMRAKVSLALALAHDPELLVLDEPTSGLDTLVRREFLESMVDRAATGRTVLLSSHQISEVERVADVVAILHAGRLVVVDRLEKLKSDTHELTVTLTQPGAEPPLLAGELLRQRRRSRQWQVLVTGAAQDAVSALQQQSVVQAVDVRTPSLEEIFVAHLQRHEETAEVGDGVSPDASFSTLNDEAVT